MPLINLALTKQPLKNPVVDLVRGDAKTQIIRMKLPKVYGGVDLSDFIWAVNYINAGGSSDTTMLGSADVSETALAIEWVVPALATSVPGDTIFELEGIYQDSEENPIVWQSGSRIIRVYDDVDANPTYDEEELSGIQELILETGIFIRETKAVVNELLEKTEGLSGRIEGDIESLESALERASEIEDEISQKNEDWTSAEAQRVENENVRISNEQARWDQNVEWMRNEFLRKEAEMFRASDEEDRIAAESARATAENERVSAESARVEAESERASAEQERAEAEDTRNSNETARSQAEDGRASQEAERQENETVREANEEQRVQQEAERVAADTARGERVEEIVQSIEGAADAANTAAENANMAAERADLAREEARGELDSFEGEIILVQDEQPESEFNKLWVQTPVEEVEVATMEDIGATLNIEKVEDYLYNYYCGSLDYEYANKYFSDKRVDIPGVGGCSTVRSGDVFGRNFDWSYDDNVEFVVKTQPSNDRYGTIGVTGFISGMTKDFVESRVYDETYKILPFMIVDGINSEGVVCSMNVVPMERGITTGTTPLYETQIEMCSLMLPRFILDRFENASYAASYIEEYVSVYMPEALRDMNYDVHIMVADKQSTYIIEFIDNRVVVLDVSSKPIMTNFHLDHVTLNEDGGVYTPKTQDATHNAHVTNGITLHGFGLERYNTINKYMRNSGMIYLDEMRELLRSLIYTKMYDLKTSMFWYTDYVGVSTVMSSVESFNDVVNQAIENYRNRERGDGKTWQTVHSSIYSISNKALYIKVQEGDIEYQYNFDYVNKKEFIDLKHRVNDLTGRVEELEDGADTPTIQPYDDTELRNEITSIKDEMIIVGDDEERDDNTRLMFNLVNTQVKIPTWEEHQKLLAVVEAQQRKITNLQRAAEGILYYEDVDNRAAYSKEVNGVLPYGLVDMIGGATQVINGELVSADVMNVSAVNTVEVGSIIHKYFPDGMHSAGTVYDEISFDTGKAITRVGVVDLGTITYNMYETTDGRLFRGILPSIKRPINSSYALNAICALYETTSKGSRHEGTISANIENSFDIIDSNYSSIASFKAAMSGVMLYYELVEYVETSMDEFNENSSQQIDLSIHVDDTITFVQNGGTTMPVPNRETFLYKTVG